MININLLPDVLRKTERMPAAHLLGVVVVGLLIAAMVWQNTKYHFDIVPGLEGRVSSLQRRKSQLQAEANELKEINEEIGRLTDHVEAVRTLYQNRVVWSKILADIKNIVNFDPAMSQYNPEMRYLWFTELRGTGKNLNFTGFASSSTPAVGMQMVERLIQRFLNYSPITLPEKDEEVRLQGELQKVMAEYDALRHEQPDLPLQGPEEIQLRLRLEEIKNIKSGGIAMKPFFELMVPGSLRLASVTWGAAPQLQQRGQGELEEVFPQRAWAFGLSLQLK